MPSPSRFLTTRVFPLAAFGALLVSASPTGISASPQHTNTSRLIASSAEPEVATIASPYVDVPSVTIAAPLTAEIVNALAVGDYATAMAGLVTLPDPNDNAQKATRSFLIAWCLVASDRASEAESVLGDLIHLDPTVVPPAWSDWITGAVLEASGHAAAAEAALSRVPPDAVVGVTAMQVRARAVFALGRSAEAVGIWHRVAESPTPLDDTVAEALLGLSRHGDASARAAARRRLFTDHPTVAARTRIDEPADLSFEERTRRGESLHRLGLHDDAIDVLSVVAAQLDASSEAACRGRWALGRSFYKRQQYAEASTAFGEGAARCISTDYGPDIAYLHGRVEAKRKWPRTAAKRYQDMERLYPDHRFADDGLVLAGNTLIDVGDVEAGRALLITALERYPEGDMVPEAAFNVGFSLYLEGRAEEARSVMTRLAALPVHRDPTYVPAGRYWMARLAMFPNVDAPTEPVATGRDLAVQIWKRLCEDQPWSFYAVLAHSRLVEEAPDVASGLTPTPQAAVEHFTVRREWWEQPAIQTAGSLLALGLAGEANKQWDAAALPPEPLEMAWWIQSRANTGDWLDGHRELRQWLRSNQPDQPDRDALTLMRVAFPDHWWKEVQSSAEEYRFPARYFHGLVRVESNFDPAAVSWAGARGLCQVMPATGRYVGKWMGMKVSATDLLDTEVNLAVGARYMDFLHEKFNDSPFLSAAGYNAGEHRVNQWLERFGNVPTDEFVERIPYDETRGYVKRVVGTWQAYRTLADGDTFPGLARFNHMALPTSGF